MDYQDSLDLLALEVELQSDSNEVASCLAQLRWLSTNNTLERAIKLTTSELINRRHVLSRSSFHEEVMIIRSASSNDMRLSDGNLSSSFIAWYRAFCTYDEGGRLRHYSPKSIERGDHPYWECINDQSLMPPERAGGKSGRRIAYLIVTSAIIDYLVEQHPRFNEGQLWEEFLTFAPDYAEYDGVKYSGTPVDFEIQEDSSDGDHLNAHYRDSKGKTQSKKVGRNIFQDELKKLR